MTYFRGRIILNSKFEKEGEKPNCQGNLRFRQCTDRSGRSGEIQRKGISKKEKKMKSNNKAEVMNQKRHVFIIGSKGIPANYGGFETFVDCLIRHHKEDSILYHVACKTAWREGRENVIYHGADCFFIRVPNVGAAQAVYYDIQAFRYCLAYIEQNKIQGAIVYVLACRIGCVISHFKRRLARLGGCLYVNPDGQEWKRAKWNRLIRQYWKFSERKMIQYADRIVCDSIHMERYIRERYARYCPRTTYLSYGADVTERKGTMSEKCRQWFREWGIEPGGYYLAVGRFVPENNFETMLREFSAAKTDKKFVLISNLEQNRFYQNLEEKTGFEEDSRICFVGTVYDKDLLKEIRTWAFAYIHGHQVGGTNPSLLESLGSTDLNLLLDVCFNREVALESAVYWTKEKGSLAAAIEEAERMTKETRQMFSKRAKKRIREAFDWNDVSQMYETLFKKEKKGESARVRKSRESK